MKNTAKRENKLIIALCWAAYTAAYIGRLNLNAYIEPIRDQLSASKTELGLVSSFFFFSYGFGQLVHGILSRKYNTRFSVAVALIGSAAVNIAMTFCKSADSMKYVWFINGVFQSILWSSVIKTLSQRLPDELLPRAVVVMSTPPAIGTFLVYGVCALFSLMGVGYKWIFLVPAAVLTGVGLLWFVLVGSISTEKNGLPEGGTASRTQKPKLTPIFILSAVLLVFAAISNGFIKDGVTTWTPSILKESYSMNESLSILATVALPLVAIFGAWISTALHKRQKNTSALNGILYLAELAVLALVTVTARVGSFGSPVLLLVLFGISAMLMSAINNVITSIIPLYLRDRMDSGLLAGVLDTFCYVGSTLSTALLGYIADRNGWSGVFYCLLIFGAVACLVCFVSFALSKKEKLSDNI